MRLLGSEKMLSLDEIAEQTGFPRSSLFRILSVLVETGLLEKTDDGSRYRAVMTLLPCGNPGRISPERVRECLDHVSGQTGNTAEWYVPSDSGLILVQRSEPENKEVSVRAGIGFVRHWNSELDAVACVGHGMEPFRRDPEARFWTYTSNGKQERLSRKEWRGMIDAALKNGFARDQCYNTNGVKRSAVPISTDGRLAGILAAAESYSFKPETENIDTIGVLTEARLSHLQKDEKIGRRKKTEENKS